MVNLRNIGKKFTEAEGKQLLEGAQKIIDEKIAGPKIRRTSVWKTCISKVLRFQSLDISKQI